MRPSQQMDPRLARDRRRIVFHAAAVLITIYGGVLRFEAVVGKYGWSGQPQWSRTLETRVVPIARELRPDEIVWAPVPNLYAGGDPVNYIRYARDMRAFYQPHVREPVFLALTKGFLSISDGRDIAVSYASALSGTLTIFATYMLGAAACSPLVGVAAALALALEFQAVTWSADGWRDDTFMLFVTLAAWALLQLWRRPSNGRGILAGVTIAGACLTRITALSFALPGVAWIAFFAPLERRRETRRAVAIASAVSLLFIAPYLVNCWRTFGDPLYAINYHTRYYRHAEGLPPDESVGALQYASAKLAARPISAVDTAVRGLITVPFFNKWNGWGPWAAVIGPALKFCGAVGALAALWTPQGRLLVLILLMSLVPYALTWSVAGGGEWRFTQHVYPIYLVLAFVAIDRAVRLLGQVVRARSSVAISRRQLARAGAMLMGAAAIWVAHALAPLLIAREALAAGDAVNITAGERDGFFFEGAWSAPIDYGNVAVRVAQADVVSMRLPMTASAYTMTLRMDPPVSPNTLHSQKVKVFLNRQPLAEVTLVHDPVRMGSYRLHVPREIVRPLSRLDLMASDTVPAREAGAPFASLPPEAPVAFRIWYVRLEAER